MSMFTIIFIRWKRFEIFVGRINLLENFIFIRVQKMGDEMIVKYVIVRNVRNIMGDIKTGFRIGI